jgi:transcriptional regulator with XRE-family HTH domain
MTPRIRRLRMEKGLTQRELAQLIGMDCPRLSRLEGGRYQLHASDLLRIAQALGLTDHPISEFFKLTGETGSGTST